MNDGDFSVTFYGKTRIPSLLCSICFQYIVLSLEVNNMVITFVLL